ncbi:MAG TPA: hypothetical protein ENF29_03990 [Candidatus Acetothermia bacterium]|nr:MAG: hypothetical protein DRJ23_02580 [Candidatus Acetothermia bacterium]HDJ30195.1 hypothetical protein [Candidatus Acetothermia bacterium]
MAQSQTEAWVPGFASFLIPGLGQLLLDEPDKAILHFGVDVAILVGGGYVASIMSPYYWYSGYSLVGLAHLAWSLYSGYDAYTTAKEKGFTLGFSGEGLTLSYNF